MMQVSVLLVFHAAIGMSIGRGHWRRSSAIQEVARRRGLRTALVVEDREPIASPGTISNADFMFKRTSNGRPIDADFRSAFSGEELVVFSDVPEGEKYDFRDYLELSNPRLLVCLNAYSSGPGQADLAFVRGAAALHPIDHHRLRYGYEFEVVNPRLPQFRPAQPWNAGKVDTVLISMGASDPERSTEALVRSAAAAGVRFLVVTGPDFESARAQRIVEMAGPNVTVLPPQDDLTDLMLSSDLLVTSGGQTVYEGAVLGIPVACVNSEGSLGAVTRHVRSGIVAGLGPVEEAPSRLREVISDPVALARTAAKGWRTVDGLGAGRIIDEALSFKKESPETGWTGDHGTSCKRKCRST